MITTKMQDDQVCHKNGSFELPNAQRIDKLAGLAQVSDPRADIELASGMAMLPQPHPEPCPSHTACQVEPSLLSMPTCTDSAELPDTTFAEAANASDQSISETESEPATEPTVDQ